MSKKHSVLWLLFMMIAFISMLGENSLIAVENNSEEENITPPVASLDGDWSMFQEQFLLPGEAKDKMDQGDDVIVSIPNSFETHFNKINSFATYSKMIQIPEEYVGETFAIHVPFQYSAYRLFVDDVQIAKNGHVGTNRTEHKAEMAPETGFFIAQNTEIQITMQISSFDHIRGGFENSIQFGKASVINRSFNGKIIGTLFLNGIIFITGFFMFVISIFRKEEASYFIFGLFAMLMSVRSLFAVPFIYKLLFLDMDWVWGTRLEYILTLLASMFYMMFLWKFHEKEFSKKVISFVVVVHLLLVFITMFTQPILFQTLFFQGMLFSIPVFFYVIYVIYKSVKNRANYAKLNVLGIIVVFIGFFNDYSIGQNWYQFYNIMLLCVTFYVFIHVFIMSKEYAESKNKTEKLNEKLLQLNKTLDKKVYKRTKELEVANEQLEKLAYIDGLTGVANRHAFNEHMDKIEVECDDTCLPIAVMIDIDDFKKYNDRYGHIAGDKILRRIAKLIEGKLSPDSLLARYGGEEFVVMLKQTPLEKAHVLAEHIRQTIENEKIEHVNSETGILTLSVGVAVTYDSISKPCMNQLINVADERLYMSKLDGRNRVTG